MKNIRVLIASDSPLQSRSLQRMLAQNGHQIVQADSGQEAMDHIDKHGVDLCFVQDVLPDKSGLELCRAYAAASEADRIPIVVFSRQAATEERALAAGAADFLKMPCQSQDALNLLENWGGGGR